MDPMYFLLIIILWSNFSSHRVDGLIEEKIIGGHVARAKQFKFVVAVMYKPQEADLPDQNPCSGTIIDEWFIVTIAHCFFDEKKKTFRNKEFYIATGVTDLRIPIETTRNIGVDLVIIPNYYDPISLDTYATVGNIAVVKLKMNLGLRRGHPTLRKLKPGKELLKLVNKTYTVAGYGWNEVRLTTHEENYLIELIQVGRSDGKLRFANVALLNYLECQNAIQDNIAVGNMCASIIQTPDEHKGICQGDGGSPLFFAEYLVGIAINGFAECNENKKPGIYINISKYNRFINDVIRFNKTKDMRIFQLQQSSTSSNNATKFTFNVISTFV